MDDLHHKLRMIISHASGGHLSEPVDVNRSTNDIAVEISRHHNRIWEQAQESARRPLVEALEALMECWPDGSIPAGPVCVQVSRALAEARGEAA
jgi:hypothetical protein